MTAFDEVLRVTMQATGASPMGAVFAIERAIAAFYLAVRAAHGEALDWDRVHADADLIKRWVVDGLDPDDARAQMARDAYALGLRSP